MAGCSDFGKLLKWLARQRSQAGLVVVAMFCCLCPSFTAGASKTQCGATSGKLLASSGPLPLSPQMRQLRHELDQPDFE